MARLCSAFYIGGTKVGALFGEAVVLTDARLRRDFRYMMKQKGGMLAKGRLLGVQFDALFTDDLYFEISRHAVELAQRVRKAVLDKGWQLRYDGRTNQQFIIIPNAAMEKLAEKYSFSFWEKWDETHSVIRICTSWATEAEKVDALVADIAAL